MDQSPSSEGTISFTGQEILCSYHPIFAKVLVLIIKVLPELANCVFRIQEIAAQPLRRAVSLTVAFTVSDKSWGVHLSWLIVFSGYRKLLRSLSGGQ